jgi:hypothetical protein
LKRKQHERAFLGMGAHRSDVVVVGNYLLGHHQVSLKQRLRCMFHGDASQPTHLTKLGCQRIQALMESGPHPPRIEADQPRPTKSGRSGSVNVTANTALKTETVTLSAACLFPVPVLSSASQVAPLAEHRPIHDFAPMAPPEGVRSARASDGPDQCPVRSQQ